MMGFRIYYGGGRTWKFLEDDGTEYRKNEFHLYECTFHIDECLRDQAKETGLATYHAWVEGVCVEAPSPAELNERIRYKFGETETFIRESDGVPIFSADHLYFNKKGIWLIEEVYSLVRTEGRPESHFRPSGDR